MEEAHMQKTDLPELKRRAIAFLHTPIKVSYMTIGSLPNHRIAQPSHPYFSNDIVMDNGTPLMILEDESALHRAIQKWTDMINATNTVMQIFLDITKPYRLQFFQNVQEYLSTEDFSEMLGEVWTDCENPNSYPNIKVEEIVKWFEKADKEILMNEEEYSEYNSLADEFKVYRGGGVKSNPHGLSWTQDEETAYWFCERFGTSSDEEDDNEDEEGHPFVYSAIAKKEDVLAYFARREETEIVISTKKLRNIHRI